MVDRVALAGATTALAGLLVLPFVIFAANRIAIGEPVNVWHAAGVWAWLLFALVVACVAAAFAPIRWRGGAMLGAGVLAFGALLFSVGHAAETLAAGGGSPERVSAGAGAWVVLAGIGIVWFEGNRHARSSGVRAAWSLCAVALAIAAVAWGGLRSTGLALEYAHQDVFWALTVSHIVLALSGAAIAALVGVPVGIWAARSGAVRATAIPVAGLIQTIPSLALFGLLIVPLTALGLPTIGTVPTLIALTLYALLPIVRNTYLGVSGVDPAVVDAGRGMGMSGGELLFRVELPLALPFILEGLRAALVLTVGIAAVMAFAGAQTLGVLVFSGFGVQASDLILLGALPMIVIAIIADQGMRALEREFVSPGIALGGEEAA